MFCRQVYKPPELEFLRTIATLCPPPMQALNIPISFFCALSEQMSVARIFPPVAPMGWPRAMAPPQGCILSLHISPSIHQVGNKKNAPFKWKKKIKTH